MRPIKTLAKARNTALPPMIQCRAIHVNLYRTKHHVTWVSSHFSTPAILDLVCTAMLVTVCGCLGAYPPSNLRCLCRSDDAPDERSIGKSKKFQVSAQFSAPPPQRGPPGALQEEGGCMQIMPMIVLQSYRRPAIIRKL